MDISQLIAPDSDEMVAADLIGAPPQVFTIAEVTETTRETGKSVANIRLEGFPRPWRPGKGMSRVMADNWGRETRGWIGKQVELYGEPDVHFGRERTGGVRISRLSGISAPKTTRINPRSGKNASWTVQPLPDAPTPAAPTPLTDAEIACVTDRDQITRWWNEYPDQRPAISARIEELKADTTADPS